ncbi:hypothetical protein LN042_05165 [Kitasatospora sp. RB6PN24]|uniref:hypothetical protein n=1 Tax=Kitasatospora humi TaxID=2893891 RepID=UPI001E3A7568|nr:hypothetical protein [Kitasatospora humi]MCC9306503.1 hypothetical protein [Kitasatospora humi]
MNPVFFVVGGVTAPRWRISRVGAPARTGPLPVRAARRAVCSRRRAGPGADAATSARLFHAWWSMPTPAHPRP